MSTPLARRNGYSRSRRLPSLGHGWAVCFLLLLSACTTVDMARQPRVDPLEPSDVFPHQQSARPALEGVISRQDEAELGPLHTGRQDGELLQEMPLEVDDDLLQRGAEHFEIYCSPCHDSAGNGQGAVVRRGFPAPPSFHQERLRDAPDGHIFDVITNGTGAMFSYAMQVDPPDRWAIIAHIRRLQEAQQAPD